MRVLKHHLDNQEELALDGVSLTLEDVISVARFRRRVSIAESARTRILRCRQMVEVLLDEGEKVYGLTTGFGKLRDIVIPRKDTKKLQVNLIRSHACGVGDPFPEDVVRAAMLLRANTLCCGHSGARLGTVEQLLKMLNDDIFPFIPQKGSVGASGDLAPLSHLILVLIGDPEGRYFPRERRKGADYVTECTSGAFIPMPAPGDFGKTAGQEGWTFKPIELEAKEGLALNNGTQFMAAQSCLTVYDSFFALRSAELSGAMSLEANRGVRGAYDRRIHQVRNHDFQNEAAQRIISYCQGSQIIDLYFNTAHLYRAIRHLEEVREFLDLTDRELAIEGLHTPPTLTHIRAHIGDLVRRLSNKQDILPMTANGAMDEDKLRALRIKPARQQIRIFDRIVMPIRQLATELLRIMEQQNFPGTSSSLKARSALVAAINQLNAIVPDTPIIQDDYSFRCYPQVLACGYRALWHVCDILEVEINSATDNPLLFPPPLPEGVAEPPTLEAYTEWLQDNLEACREGVIGGGNFHGEPIAVAMDYLAIAMSEMANISERRVAHLVDENHSRGLPSFLIESSGLNSGFMIPQYTAAALVSENKVLSHPASTDSIPTCANTEDHVSMGSISARKAAAIVKNVRYVVAIEILTAFQALSFRRPLLPGKPIRAVLELLAEKQIEHYKDDRVIYKDIERIFSLMTENDFLDCLLT